MQKESQHELENKLYKLGVSIQLFAVLAAFAFITIKYLV